MSRRTELRPELEGICPTRMRARPIDERGYSIPYFVGYVNGKPDFRCADQAKFAACVKFKKCWLCGEKLGVHHTFVIGPMCVVNRVTSEPPCHLECATYAMKGCPFLKLPNAQYRLANRPEGYVEPAGVGLTHNPTACALYTCREWHLVKVSNGYLLQLGEPSNVEFWHRAQLATRGQVIDAMNIGLPKLAEVAREEGPDSLAELRRMLHVAQAYLPADGPEMLVLP